MILERMNSGKTNTCSVTAAKLVMGTGFIYYALIVEKGIAFMPECHFCVDYYSAK